MKTVETLSHVVIRFAGDSGDGMQLTGGRFAAGVSSHGNDLMTLPSYPAEIRAPKGTLAGVSSFQLRFSDTVSHTAGDDPNVLVAMNPAALRANLPDIPRGSSLIVNSDEFTRRNVIKAGYDVSPLDDGSLDSWQVHQVALTSMTVAALGAFAELSRKDKERAKNMFALGLVSWLYHRPTTGAQEYLRRKFAQSPGLLGANLAALSAGFNFGETCEDFAVSYEVAPAPMEAGTYRSVSGNVALAYGLAAGAHRAARPLVLGSYPITPASDILHTLAALKQHGITTLQAEDEIAGIGMALGASFGGAVGVTTTSGPGLALKSETIGLAVSLELPLVIVNVQRGGPSTGLPTKTEQSDLLQALYGRNGESPVPVLAASTPSDCFDAALEAVRIALTYRTPVILLSDGYIANGSEPWATPILEDLPDLREAPATQPNGLNKVGEPAFHPYARDAATLARPWAVPGTPGLEHRIGGLEKADVTGEISYDADNHDRMVRLRARKVANVVVAPLSVDDPLGEADVLILGWGSTYGPTAAAVAAVRAQGHKVAHAHLRHLNPLPTNTGDVLNSYKRVLVPEMNLGQLSLLLQGHYAINIHPITQVRGTPFSVAELADTILAALKDAS